MSRRRNTWMMGFAAGVLTLGMMTGCSRVPETIPEIDTSPPFYEPSGEDQTEPEGSYTTGGLTEENTEGMELTEAGSEALTDQDTEAHLTESAEAETAEAPEPEESTEGTKEPETKESEAIWPTTAPQRPSMPESTESKAETTTRPVTEAETAEALEAEETEPTETEPTEGETETPAETEPETEEVTEPVTQPTSESVKEPNRESEGSTERETEAEIVLQAIQIKANQSQYAQGWKLTKANLTITLCYSDGTSGTLTNGYSIHQTGDQVYVTYDGIKSNTITVVYEKTLTSISIESKADRYEQGYQIISANLKVTLHYSDNSAETLAHGYTIHQTGARVYITYNGVTSNTITINYAAASRVEIKPKAERYGLGDVITIEDFIVTAYQADGSSQVVTSDLKLFYKGEEVTSVTLTEYEGDIYVMGAHSFQVSYKDVLSESAILKVKYEEKGYLYREMLTLVNEARTEAGLPALTWDTEAEEEILIRAEELTKYYSHTRPAGEATTELYAMFWGENIANGGYYSRTHVQNVFDAWMNSAGHRSLILDSFEYATGFVCAYHIATDANGNQAAYTVMWVTMN